MSNLLVRASVALTLLTTFPVTSLHASARSCLTGTTIMAIRTPSEILVGADSKMVAVRENTPSDAGLICKINQADQLFFAHAGLLGDFAETFNVPATVLRARQQGGDFSETVTRFEQMTVGPLAKVLEEIRCNQPEYYQRHLEGHPAVEVLFFGFTNGTPVLYHRSFVAVGSSSGSVSLDIRRQDCAGTCPSGLTFAFLGHHDAIERFLAENPDFFSRYRGIETLTKLIGLEIEATPALVGPPIDILQITGTGARWVQKKAQCPEIRRN